MTPQNIKHPNKTNKNTSAEVLEILDQSGALQYPREHSTVVMTEAGGGSDPSHRPVFLAGVRSLIEVMADLGPEVGQSSWAQSLLAQGC